MHLPGILIPVTVLLIIDVPVPLACLERLDSLLSIVQMPSKVPVATTGAGNAKSVALLAVWILSSNQGGFDARLRQKMPVYQTELRQVTADKGTALHSVTSGLSR